jgi:hypothetical protein
MRIAGMGIDRFLVRPPVDDVKCVGIVDLLVEIIVEAPVLEASGFDKLQNELPNPVSIRRLATQLTDDVTFL